MLLSPKESDIDVVDQNGQVSGKYILSKFPAVAGREIVAKYPLSGFPKLGDYKVNEETMLKLMSYVAVPVEGRPPISLSTRALVDNHVASWETLAQIELAMLEYNCSFFRNGRASSFFDAIAQKLPPLITKILTDSLQSLSQKEKQPSTS